MLLGGSFRAGNPASMIGLGSRGHCADGTQYARNVIQHGQLFGQSVSLPQGYNSVSAVRMPIKTGSKISARIQGSSSLLADLRAALKAGATLSGNSAISANALLGLVRSAALSGNSAISASVTAALKARATLDAGARPSAFDIAQEIWQSPKTAYNAAGTMGNALNAAGSGGVDLNALANAVWTHATRSLTDRDLDAVVEGTTTLRQALRLLLAVNAGDATGLEGASAVFKSLDGTKDRVVATQSGGSRTVTSRDVS